MSQPYVYFLMNKTTGLKYIGAKYAKNADHRTFWKNYFTSSKHVKKLIDLFGKDDFKFKILKVFPSAYEALKYENNLNKLAFYRNDYLNIHFNFIGNHTEDEFTLAMNRQRKIASFFGKLSVLMKTGIHGLTEEEKLVRSSKGGLAAAIINRKLSRGLFCPELRKKNHEILKEKQVSAYYDPILKLKISSMGGKSSIFSKAYHEKHGLSEEDRIRAQSDRGKIGGAKNKGFKWYNDGTSDFKYTPSNQEKLSFDKFLQDNPHLKAGRLSVTIKRIWVNDGIRNMMIPENMFDQNKHTIGRLGNRSKNNGHKNKTYNPD
jgi:hypothetical protein